MIVGQFGIHILCSPPSVKLCSAETQSGRVGACHLAEVLLKKCCESNEQCFLSSFLPFLCNVNLELLWFAEAWFLNSSPLSLCVWYDFDSHLLYFAQERKWGMRGRRESCIDCWCVVLLLRHALWLHCFLAPFFICHSVRRAEGSFLLSLAANVFPVGWTTIIDRHFFSHNSPHI